MQQYIGTKIIHAEPAQRVVNVADKKPDTPLQVEDGYRVRYPDGYVSWSPKEAFEAAYRPTDGMNFGLAIEALKKGKRVARAGWNGKGMFLQLVRELEYAVSHICDVAHLAPDVAIAPWIGMKTADNKFVPWLASQTDMLADDWQIVP